MPPTTPYSCGDVVLVPFPFTDLTRTKQRPAVIVSRNSFNAGLDVVIAAITSHPLRASEGGDYPLVDWKSAGLLGPSVVRTGKLLTLHKDLIRRRLGQLSEQDLAAVLQRLAGIFNLSPTRSLR